MVSIGSRGRNLATLAFLLAGIVCTSRASELSKSDQRWLAGEALALITTEEARIFRELDTKEDRELFRELFWVRRDPDLMTPENEFKKEFQTRVRTADRRFRQRGRKGSMTDMGVIFLLLGFATSSDWNVQDQAGYSSVTRPAGLGDAEPGENSRMGDDTPDIQFVNPGSIGLSNQRAFEVRWFYDPDPERGIPEGLTVPFRAERYDLHTMNRTEDLEQALERIKRSYVIHPDIDYQRDTHGRLMRPPARFDPRSPAKKAMREMMENDAIETDVSFETEVAFFRSQRDAYVPLHLEIDPEPLSWEGGAADITLFGVVEDDDGQPARRFEEQTNIQRAEDGSAVFDIPLYLSPGSYILNLGVLDERSGRVGTKKVPVFVPDFQGDRLRLSSVLLYEDKRQASQPPEASGRAFQFGGTEFLLRHDKTFQTKGSLGLFFFAYGYRLDNGRKPNLTSHYVLLKDGKLQGQIADQPLQGSSLQAAANIEIPLADLEPGHYQIEIRVTDLIAQEITTERAEFTLKPVPFPIESYSSLVKEYRSGSFVSARNALSNVSLRSLEDATREFRGDSTSDDELKAAALLHTDVAILSRTAEETLHLKTARDYLARIENPSSRRGFEHQWFLAVSHHLQVQSTAWSAFPMLDEALNLFPESIEIRLAVASVYEKMGRRGVDGMLQLAEELYREILSSDPAHAETRLRLGRILQLQRRSAEALRELEWGLAHTDDPDLKFLAHMLMGESYDCLDELSKVVESYRSALEIDPDCQSAAIALSHALHRWGDRASSRKVMVDYFSRNKEDRADRWWQFVMGSTARGESMLETMRQEVHLE